MASSAATQTGTSTAARSIVTNADSPISQFITTAFSWLKYFLGFIPSFRPWLFWPVPIFLYLFAPVFVFSKLVMTVFFFGPYKIILYFLDALYPLYVLVGVACITGGVLGIVGRQLSRLLIYILRVQTDRKDGLRGTRRRVDLKGKARKVKLEP